MHIMILIIILIYFFFYWSTQIKQNIYKKILSNKFIFDPLKYIEITLQIIFIELLNFQLKILIYEQLLLF